MTDNNRDWNLSDYHVGTSYDEREDEKERAKQAALAKAREDDFAEFDKGAAMAISRHPDWDQAQKFLECLDCNATSWTFQTFHDNYDRKTALGYDSLAKVFNGTLSEHWDALTQASNNGAGVFVTINETDGKGRKARNIKRVRAVFVDTDGADIEPIKDAEPHILVESSGGNFHAYWLVDDAPLESFKPAQKTMIEAWGTDKSITDLPRVMRLPGFPHQKVNEQKGLTGKQFMVKIVEDNTTLGRDAWSARKAKIDKLNPTPADLPAPPVMNDDASPVDEINIADVKAPLIIEPSRIEKALSALPAADLPYGEWIIVGMALCHQFGGSDEGFQLWDQWSQDDPRYAGKSDLTGRWSKFGEGSDDPVTFRSVLAMAKKRKPDYLLPDWAADWVYNEKLMEFHNVPTGHSIKPGAFNAKFNREWECIEAECSASALVLRHMRTFANTMFWPCDDEIITFRGLEYVNVFKPHDVEALAPSTPTAEAAVKIIIDHAYSLATEPSEAELLLTFLAYIYQNPGKRVRWAIVLFGIQGNGKSFWVELMKRLMGHNAGEVAGTTVAQRFTGWAVNKLFIAIEEIRVPSESKYAVLDKMKPFISNNEVNVELKGQDDRVVPNFASYLLLTNHDDALPLDDDDRRYCVIETKHRTKADIPGQGYFNELFGALKDHIEAIAHYFAARPIPSDFNPNGRAPETRGRHRMMEESKSGPRLAVEDAIAELDCKVINDDFVYVSALLENAKAWLTGPILPDRRSVGRILKDMGYVKHTVGDKHQGPKIGKKERTIYYRPNRTLPSDFMPIVTQHITDFPI
ncbi:MAG: DUF5906 domain-containing protein [Paracoccaceae bacterium]|nr:DUF5906 domain-containing protein [Paracoccaceae bacterium]